VEGGHTDRVQGRGSVAVGGRLYRTIKEQGGKNEIRGGGGGKREVSERKWGRSNTLEPARRSFSNKNMSYPSGRKQSQILVVEQLS